MTFLVFESSCHLLLPSKHSKVEAIPLSALPKDTTSKLAGLYTIYKINLKLSILYAERQAGKQ